ncbi:hypothetical protein DXG01_016724 [Tephrocybe rancida]|nr:hypothetical protein DXG01_016724 [Tephrocybe rancida]
MASTSSAQMKLFLSSPQRTQKFPNTAKFENTRCTLEYLRDMTAVKLRDQSCLESCISRFGKHHDEDNIALVVIMRRVLEGVVAQIKAFMAVWKLLYTEGTGMPYTDGMEIPPLNSSSGPQVPLPSVPPTEGSTIPGSKGQRLPPRGSVRAPHEQARPPPTSNRSAVNVIPPSGAPSMSSSCEVQAPKNPRFVLAPPACDEVEITCSQEVPEAPPPPSFVLTPPPCREMENSCPQEVQAPSSPRFVLAPPPACDEVENSCSQEVQAPPSPRIVLAPPPAWDEVEISRSQERDILPSYSRIQAIPAYKPVCTPVKENQALPPTYSSSSTLPIDPPSMLPPFDAQFTRPVFNALPHLPSNTIYSCMVIVFHLVSADDTADPDIPTFTFPEEPLGAGEEFGFGYYHWRGALDPYLAPVALPVN